SRTGSLVWTGTSLMSSRMLNSCWPTTSIPTTFPSASKSSITKPESEPKGSVRTIFASRRRMYAAVASVSISTTGGSVMGMMKPLAPVSGDDQALIEFDFGYDYQSFPLEYPEEQPKHSAVITTTWRSFEN